MAMDIDTIPNLLGDQRDAAPDELQHYFLQFEDYWERKLWHELTDSLVEFYSDPKSASQRLPLFEGFVLTFAEKINQLKLVTLGQSAASQSKDDKSRLEFLQKLAAKINKTAAQDAYVYALVTIAGVHLQLGELDEARKNLDECEAQLEQFDYVETMVHAAFYRVSADYHKVKAEFASYYKNALLYLACIDLNSLTQTDRQSRAYDLSIAALVSDSIYNFGELLLHPILDSLKDTKAQWLRDLLFAFNSGNLDKYGELSNNLDKDQQLSQHKDFLYQKISLSALTQTVFKRPPHDRAMTFSTIVEETRIRPEHVEYLIMKALSLGLVRGTIDQVAEIARINWVQPKVLDMDQIESMRVRLREWDSSVNSLGNWIEGVGKDVWAA